MLTGHSPTTLSEQRTHTHRHRPSNCLKVSKLLKDLICLILDELSWPRTKTSPIGIQAVEDNHQKETVWYSCFHSNRIISLTQSDQNYGTRKALKHFTQHHDKLYTSIDSTGASGQDFK